MIPLLRENSLVTSRSQASAWPTVNFNLEASDFRDTPFAWILGRNREGWILPYLCPTTYGWQPALAIVKLSVSHADRLYSVNIWRAYHRLHPVNKELSVKE